MNDLLDAALRYAAIGWPIFPVDQLKKPLRVSPGEGLGGVHEATTNPDKLRDWWAVWPEANPALNVGAAGMMVVDVDPGADLGELNRAVEGLPATRLRQTTPRGGSHEFYALAPGEEVSPSASKLAPHVDVRSAGSYVLLSPSRTIDGPGCKAGTYTWDHERTWPTPPTPKPAYRTEALLRACGQKRERLKHIDERIIDADLPESIAAAVAWVHSDKCHPAVEFQGGDDWTYKTAAMMHSFGLSEDTALDIMVRDYNPTKCSPPWDYDVLELKVRNAYQYRQSEFGNKSPAWLAARVKKLFHPVAAALSSGVERSAGRFRIVDREGIEHIRDPEWLIPDLIPKNAHVLMVGAPGTFKTFVALDLALSVAMGSGEGRAWPQVVEAGPVLFAAGEGRPGLKRRLQAWEKQHNKGEKARDFHLIDPVPLVSAGAVEWEGFCDLALDLSPEGYPLTVIDTAGRALQGRSENDQEYVSLLTQMVQLIQRRLNGAVLVLHHSGLSDANRAKGSGVFHADPDTVIVLRREGKTMNVALSMAKQKDGVEWELPKRVMLIPSGASLSVGPSTTKEPVQPEAERAKHNARLDGLLDNLVSRMLRANPLKAWTQKELAETLACRDDVDVLSGPISAKLKQMRENSASISGGCYWPETKIWRWREKGTTK